MSKFFVMGAMFALMGCASMSMTPSAQSGGMPKDGELAFPSNYTSFPTFLKGIQKPNAIRDLFINNTGVEAHKGEPFANGSILVMEIYNAKKGPNGEFTQNSQGHLTKDGLAKVYVMQKGKGWGENAPKGQQNGDWIYSAFQPNGERLDVEYAKCRTCHLPLGDAQDYVQRYDEYFDTREHAH